MTDKFLIDPDDLGDDPVGATIIGFQRQMIDGVPRLVMLLRVGDQDRGVVMTRQMVDDLSEMYGRNKIVDEFFGLH